MLIWVRSYGNYCSISRVIVCFKIFCNTTVKVLMTSVFANPAAVLPQFWSKNHVIPSEATENDFFDFIEKRSTVGNLDLASISKDFSSLKSLFDQLSEDQDGFQTDAC